MADDRILCFVKREARPLFTPETMPRLVYVSRTQPSDRAYHSILHAHQDLAEVLLICGGEGRFLVGETFYEVKAGDLLLYNSGVVHDEFSSAENAISAYCAAISGLRLLMDMMYRVLREDRPGCEALCHHLTLALLGSILQLTGDAPRRDRTETEPKTLGRQVQAFIDGHFSEPLTLQDMGKALHVSPYYLSHVFKEASGYSPTQYLLRRRIGEAQNLLISTDLPMAKIAEQVGFETQNYFNLQFSKHVGMPPGKYRESFVGKKKP